MLVGGGGDYIRFRIDAEVRGSYISASEYLLQDWGVRSSMDSMPT